MKAVLLLGLKEPDTIIMLSDSATAVWIYAHKTFKFVDSGERRTSPEHPTIEVWVPEVAQDVA